MLHNNLWQQAVGILSNTYKNISYEDSYLFLCISCIESILNRKLTIEDFTHMPINIDNRNRSEILQDRLKGFKEKYEYECYKACFLIIVENHKMSIEDAEQIIYNRFSYKFKLK